MTPNTIITHRSNIALFTCRRRRAEHQDQRRDDRERNPRTAAKTARSSTTIRPQLPRYMLAIRPQTKSFFSTNSSGPGCRPQISRPPIITAVVGEPGMPSVSIGKERAGAGRVGGGLGRHDALDQPVPNFSPFFDMRLATP